MCELLLELESLLSTDADDALQERQANIARLKQFCLDKLANAVSEYEQLQHWAFWGKDIVAHLSF